MTFRGRVTAAAFVVDRPLIGEHEARQRVLEWWGDGARVYELPTGVWLVVLAKAVTVRAEKAPGLPLTDPTAVPVGGDVLRADLDQLPKIDLADWIDMGEMHRLTPADAPLTATRAVETPIVRTQRAVGKLGQEEPAPKTGFMWRFARLVTQAAYERYLRRLSRLFEQRQWDDALREAIGVRDGAGTKPAYRLPRRRTGQIKPTFIMRPSNRTVGSSGGPRLNDMYRTAAQRLEHEGRIDEAAFVYADLLNQPSTAVAVLERHQRYRTAAELAEGRRLAPDVIVRLWWQAGDRDRAITVARTFGAFATAIAFMSRVDKEAARPLRIEWVRFLQQANDHLAAVEAAWPADDLRPTVLTNIQHGMALGGRTAAHLLAYLLAEWPSADTQRAAMSTLDGEHRGQFVATLTKVTIRDPAVDRRICTAALRASLGDDTPVSALTYRADPLLVVDLPARRMHADPNGTLVIEVPLRKGELPILDAVALDSGAFLIAHGDLGVTLRASDDTIRARWSVPAHELVVADHGGSALLVARLGESCEIHRLDLTSRKVTRWTSLHNTRFVPSYDGAIAITVDEDGIAWLDTHAEPPRVMWRELTRDNQIRSLQRVPNSLAAAVDDELWHWDLPSMALRRRVKLPEDTTGLLANGNTITCDSPRVSGSMFTTGTLVHAAAHTTPALDIRFPESDPPGFRAHGTNVTLWDNAGRLVAADITQRRVLSTE
ncbi:bpX6 domain-containing protein [Actinocrispum wychmicini]|uniref:MoxR-vWA-beta-propeller ternary system domain-containing protein n=1 Tax=Actinocrispum wychmicini TaxID=1213861 RepID=A0A4R2JXF2_9PSEU|nr:bpX6 domain-containing protein [Actinocrispum wychmicini]TCO62078.1 hypothetical protein EV192_102215 [Actinocrispum wychmicini]